MVIQAIERAEKTYGTKRNIVGTNGWYFFIQSIECSFFNALGFELIEAFLSINEAVIW